jgi:hypothetical protein
MMEGNFLEGNYVIRQINQQPRKQKGEHWQQTKKNYDKDKFPGVLIY